MIDINDYDDVYEFLDDATENETEFSLSEVKCLITKNELPVIISELNSMVTYQYLKKRNVNGETYYYNEKYSYPEQEKMRLRHKMDIEELEMYARFFDNGNRYNDGSTDYAHNEAMKSYIKEEKKKNGW